MAHHGSDRIDEKTLAEIFGKKGEKMIGATGSFPEGKLTDNDEGELRVMIGQKDGKVVIDFGTSTTWIGFTPHQANELAAILHLHAAEIQART